MSRSRLALPERLLDQVRLVALVFGSAILITQLAELGNPTKSPQYHLYPVLSVALLVLMLIVTHVRHRAQWWDLLTMPVLLAVTGSGLSDPLDSVGSAIATTLVISLYGSLASWALRTAGALAGIVAAVVLSPATIDGPQSWTSPKMIGVLPTFLLISMVMRGTYAAVRRQELAAAREAILTGSAREMLAAADVDDVLAVGRRTAARLIELSPGVVFVALRRGPDGIRISTLVGRDHPPAGTGVPEDVLHDPAVLSDFVPGIRHWRSEYVHERLFVAIGSPSRMIDDVFDNFVNLAYQVVLAENSRVKHAELDHRANHDQLTKLPTRAKFFRALEQAVDHDPPGTVALLNIDLDDFKQINDRFGHAGGDQLLVEVAERISAVGGARSMPGRFGGDEFAVLLTGLAGPVEAEQVAELLCARLVAPIQLGGGSPVNVGASIGVAVNAPGLTAGDLTKCADLAMYSAKAQGKNRVELFHPDLHGDAAQHRIREKHLASAVQRDEVAITYQPQAGPDGGVTMAAHARWRRPSSLHVDADDLLEMAARTGNLGTLTGHMIRTVCGDLAGPDGPDFSLDVSGPQLLDPGFARQVTEALDEFGIDPRRMVLRLVGPAAVQSAGLQQMHRLAAAGVRIALDPANTRAATLASLRAYPVHRLSVDAGDTSTLALVSVLAPELGADVVVEDPAVPEMAAAALTGPR